MKIEFFLQFEDRLIHRPDLRKIRGGSDTGTDTGEEKKKEEEDTKEEDKKEEEEKKWIYTRPSQLLWPD